MKFYRYIIVILLVSSLGAKAQERVTTFGVQLKPIIPVQFFDAGKQEKSFQGIDYTNDPKLGMSLGMVIRIGITKSISLETGINYVRRSYDLTIAEPDSGFSGTSQFRILNYELPVQGLIYVQLNRNMFMNVSGGLSFNFYPTPLYTFSDYYSNAVARTNWMQTSLIANIGWEYRTESSGYFYFGASLHRPFQKIMTEYVEYTGEDGERSIIETFDLSGNYLIFKPGSPKYSLTAGSKDMFVDNRSLDHAIISLADDPSLLSDVENAVISPLAVKAPPNAKVLDPERALCTFANVTEASFPLVP